MCLGTHPLTGNFSRRRAAARSRPKALPHSVGKFRATNALTGSPVDKPRGFDLDLRDPKPRDGR